jgi:hypothetical protein
VISDRISRWIYGAETVLIGLPTIGVALPMLFLLLLASVVVVAPSGMDITGFLFLVWSLTGMLGLTAWFVLTGHYLIGGRESLRTTAIGWWFALLSGVASACVALAMTIKGGFLHFQWLDLFAGPLLILPALHLLYLRFAK